jgi:hypothetical protein
MAASGYTPIQLYYSTTASAVPTSGNLLSGELAININDGKLYFKNSGGTVTLLASSGGASGDVVGPASATDNALVAFDGTTGKLVKQASTVTVAQGGTGQTTYTDGQLLIGNTTGNTLTKATLTAGSGVSITNGSGSITIAATGSGGTVTTVSVVSANGLAGTVANATTTPAITLSTSVTGVLKGNGTAISAAVSGTDYAPATSGTSILYGNGSGGFSNVTIGTGLTFAAGTLTATATSSTSIGLVRAIAINCILP